MITREDANKKLRERRKRNGNYVTHRYEKTKHGFLVRKYRNMKSRITGVQKRKYHLYLGLDLLCKEDFYDWADKNETFHDLFAAWEISGYQRVLCPSVDRINSDLGYTISNMEWVTHSENSRRGSISSKNIRKNNEK